MPNVHIQRDVSANVDWEKRDVCIKAKTNDRKTLQQRLRHQKVKPQKFRTSTIPNFAASFQCICVAYDLPKKAVLFGYVRFDGVRNFTPTFDFKTSNSS